MEEEKLHKRGYTLYLDEELIKKLEAHARLKRLSPSWLANEWLNDKLKKKEDKK